MITVYIDRPVATIFYTLSREGNSDFLSSFFSLIMVSWPKTKKTRCHNPSCNKHTTHKISQVKAGKRRVNAEGERRYRRKQSGFGGQTKPVFHKKAKTTKKILLRLECAVCKQKHQVSLARAKVFEIAAK
ncbi:hypothetical protein GEMRC1_008810 [Eukaryota sp. GEM-RC1]